VGGKLAVGPALGRLGINSYPMGRGKRATIMASPEPWRPDEKAIIQHVMEEVYKAFVARVADGRRMAPEQVLPIAQGRVWTGSKAKELGLVDEIGGLDAAIAEARKLAGVDKTAGLEVYPPAPTIRDLLEGFGDVQAPAIAIEDHQLTSLMASAVDPLVAQAAKNLLDLALSFRTTRIQAVTALPVIR
jgi:protease IV